MASKKCIAECVKFIRNNPITKLTPHYLAVRSAGFTHNYVRVIVVRGEPLTAPYSMIPKARKVWMISLTVGNGKMHERLEIAHRARDFFNHLHQISLGMHKYTPEVMQQAKEFGCHQKVLEAICKSALGEP